MLACLIPAGDTNPFGSYIGKEIQRKARLSLFSKHFSLPLKEPEAPQMVIMNWSSRVGLLWGSEESAV